MPNIRKKRKVEEELIDTPFEFPEFEVLPATTITSVVYSNLKVDGNSLFKELVLSERADPRVILHTKQERKEFCEDFPPGKIISIQYKNQIRGCIIRKPKLYWCNVCQLWAPKGDPPIDEHVNTVTERYEYNTKTGITKIRCYCSNCKKVYDPKDLKVLSYFRNQVMVYMTTDRNLVNLMIFASQVKITNIKMAGCSNIQESRQIIANFWKNKIYPTGSWSLFSPESKAPKFVFEEGMININFKFGSFVDPEKFYELWFKHKKLDGVDIVTYGSVAQKSINIKFDRVFAGAKTLLTFPTPGAKKCMISEITEWPEDIVHIRKKKKKDTQPTIVVFMTTSTLVTGKASQELKHWYDFFRDVVLKNEEDVKEVIQELDIDALDSLLAEK